MTDPDDVARFRDRAGSGDQLGPLSARRLAVLGIAPAGCENAPMSTTTPRARPVDGPPTADDLAATATFDFDEPTVRAWALEVVDGASDDVERARRLFADVRDRIRYDPYGLSPSPDALTASAVLASEGNWCVPKAVLLTAGARAAGMPARIGFADVRNHLSSDKLRARMGSDLFVFHGYVALHVGGAWWKASPAFNAELCARFGTPPLEFDGRSDALLHAYDGAGRRHMEYVNDRGTWTGVPFDDMMAAFAATYSGGEGITGPRPERDAAFD
jgi:transglutaminase-like putative cysteine protease